MAPTTFLHGAVVVAAEAAAQPGTVQATDPQPRAVALEAAPAPRAEAHRAVARARPAAAPVPLAEAHLAAAHRAAAPVEAPEAMVSPETTRVGTSPTDAPPPPHPQEPMWAIFLQTGNSPTNTASVSAFLTSAAPLFCSNLLASVEAVAKQARLGWKPSINDLRTEDSSSGPSLAKAAVAPVCRLRTVACGLIHSV